MLGFPWFISNILLCGGGIIKFLILGVFIFPIDMLLPERQSVVYGIDLNFIRQFYQNEV
jgi:hypothetical protein